MYFRLKVVTIDLMGYLGKARLLGNAFNLEFWGWLVGLGRAAMRYPRMAYMLAALAMSARDISYL